jgi:RNA polymerase sigma factor (sigma-70 family)
MPDRYIKQFLDGDKEAFRFIIRECKDGAYNLAISILKDDDAAKDAAQRAFLKAYQNLRTFRGQSGFKTWFHRIVVNEALQLKRSRKPEHNLNFDETEISPYVENEIEKRTENDHLAYYVNKLLDEMRLNESLALKLFYLEEHSVEEVSEVTGWSVSNVKVTLHRARKTMKEKLKEKYNLNPEEFYS